MSIIIQNVVMGQHSRNRMMLLNRLNTLEEVEKTMRRRASIEKGEPFFEDDVKPVDYRVVLRDIFYVIFYFIVGVLFYHFHEKWGVVKCVYFIIVSSKYNGEFV